MRPLSEAPRDVQVRFRACVSDLNKKLNLGLESETYSFMTRGNKYLFTSSQKGSRRIVMTMTGERPSVSVEGVLVRRRTSS